MNTLSLTVKPALSGYVKFRVSKDGKGKMVDYVLETSFKFTLVKAQ